MARPSNETTAKAQELSGLDEAAFKALPKEERSKWLNQAAQALDGADGSDPANPAEIEFVQMTRDSATYPAPHTAQVHPNEVKNYASSGWVARAD